MNIDWQLADDKVEENMRFSIFLGIPEDCAHEGDKFHKVQ